MRLLIVTQKVNRNDPILGFFHRWIEEFAKHCELVTVICLEKGTYDLPQNVRVLSLGKGDVASRFAYLLRFYRYIFSERKNYDGVFVHMNPIYVVLGGLFWKAAHKRIGLWYTHKHVDLKLRLGIFLADKVFTASMESLRLSSPKVAILGHGVDMEQFRQSDRAVLSGERIELLSVGRISSIKQTKKAILILEDVLSKTDAFLTIIGSDITSQDAVYKKQLLRYIHDKGLGGYIRFVGSVPHEAIPAVLSRADVLLHTSATGSMDKIVLEGLLSGTLVLTEGEAFKPALDPLGMFVDGGVGQFVERIFVFRQDPSMTLMVIRRGRVWVKENHDLANLIRNICQNYES